MIDPTTTTVPHVSDPRFVVLSVALAIGAAYAAIDLARRVAGTRGAAGRMRLMAGAVGLGIGIWSTHVAGMLAFGVLGPLHYGWPTLGASLVAVVVASAVALHLMTRERRYAAQDLELQAAARRYRLLFERGHTGIVQISMEGQLLDCNGTAARIFGYPSAAALRAAPLAERFYDSAEREAILEHVAARRGISHLEHRMRRADGTPVWVQAAISVVEGQDGLPIYEAAVVDISDRRDENLSLRHAQKLEAVGALAAGIAHEINTPVQFLSDNTQFLDDSFESLVAMVECYERLAAATRAGDLTGEGIQQLEVLAAEERRRIDWEYLRAEVPTALDQMREGLSRVAKIVGAMRDFARIDHGSEMAAGDINKALESILVVARNEFKYVAETHTDFRPLPPVMCHLGDLNQAFLNLVINAAHAIEDAVAGTTALGRIDIATRQNGDWVEIDVADTGTGIAPEIREKIFEPFFTTKKTGRGAGGQGLALAHAIIVEKHGGTLTLDTEVGKGTTLHIRIPIRAVHAAAPPLAA